MNISGDDIQEFPSCIGTALQTPASVSAHITPDSYSEMSEMHSYKCNYRVLRNSSLDDCVSRNETEQSNTDGHARDTESRPQCHHPLRYRTSNILDCRGSHFHYEPPHLHEVGMSMEPIGIQN